MKKISTFLILIFSFGLISCVQTESAKTVNQNNQVESAACDITNVDESLTDPQSIRELINLINALPRPMSAQCLIKSLKRPLLVNATASILSAQPAGSWNDPRIFIFKGNLIIAVVPSGAGAKLLEFSEMLTTVRSIKGEIVLPVTGRVSQSDPFSHINYSSRTTCSGCHGSERLETTVDGVNVYSSFAFKPFVNDDVSLDYLKDTHYICQTQLNTSQSCQLMKALFSHGEVTAKSFPDSMPFPQNTFGL